MKLDIVTWSTFKGQCVIEILTEELTFKKVLKVKCSEGVGWTELNKKNIRGGV